MKTLVLTFLILMACSFSIASPQPSDSDLLIGQVVIVHLDSNSQAVTATVVSESASGVLVRIQATGKLYFYPQSRLSGLEQL